QFGRRCSGILAAVEGQSASGCQQPAATSGNKGVDVSQLFGGKKTRFYAAQDQTLVRKEFFLGPGKAAYQFLRARNPLTIKLVLAGALQRNEGDVLFIELK